MLRGKARVIAIKENVNIYPAADMVYGCDAAWWRHRKGLPDFTGLRVCWAPEIPREFPGVAAVKIRMKTASPPTYIDKLVLDSTDEIGGGGNSGFQAMNLALRFGSRRIILVGFDMTDRGGVHWYGRNTWHAATNPTDTAFARWLQAFAHSMAEIQRIGAEIVNASAMSALNTFPRRSIEDALKEWGV